MRTGSTILIVASGTRGDVEPLTVLARSMADRGMRPVIAAHAPYEQLVLDAGLPFEPLAENPSMLLARVETESLSAATPAAMARAWRRYLRAGRACYRAMAERTTALAGHAGALILGLPTFWLSPVARFLRIPVICCPLQPLTPTADFPCSWLGARSMPGWANRITHTVGTQLIWQPWRATITAWARDALPGAAPGFFGPLHSMLVRDVPFVYGISPHVLNRPRDWPAHHVLTGYWIDDRAEGTVPAGLRAFLDAPGPPVVFVTLGSVDFRAGPVMLQVRSVLGSLGLRAVIQTTHMHAEISGDGAYVTPGPLPHGALFRSVAAVIHHGGAGTLARAIAAGTPSLALTGPGDGAWWGAQAWAAGVSPRPLPIRRLDTGALRESIRRLVDSRPLRARAETLGAAVRTEDGPGLAAGIIARALGSG